MVTSEQLDRPPFNWGDTVRIITPDFPNGQYGQLASVCGFRFVADDRITIEKGKSIGNWLILIEIADGSSFEIPASNLEIADG
jgi:hypothetical protein